MIAFIWYVTQSVNPDQKYANKHRDCKDPVKNYPLCSSCLKQRQASITCHFSPPVSFSTNSVPVSAYFNYLYCYTVFQFFGFAVLHGEKLDFVVLSCFIILTICGHNFANAFSQQWGDRLLLWTRMLTWRRQEILLSYSTQLDLFNYEFRFSTRLYAWSHSSADMDPAIQLLE